VQLAASKTVSGIGADDEIGLGLGMDVSQELDEFLFDI
jgi:hypothetical protein